MGGRAVWRGQPHEESVAWYTVIMVMRCRWTGGRYGVGSRIKLRYTRAIIDAIHSGELKTAQTTATPIFNLAVRVAACLPGLGGVVMGVSTHVLSGQWLL